jgi:predicted O-methyltransferase YrrM
VREFVDDFNLPVVVVHGDSLDWWPPPYVTTFDFCFFDSGTPATRIEEFKRFRSLMRPGTIVCFHDTAPRHAGAFSPDLDFRSTLAAELRPRLRMIHLPTPRGLTIGEVLPL